MKTLVLATASAAALMIAGAALAADPSVPLSQIGTTGAETANTSSMIDQIGDNNYAATTQGGKNNSSVVLQDSGTAARNDSPNRSVVNQSGTGGRALVEQNTSGTAGTSTANVSQYGKNESAFAYQLNDNYGSTSTIVQNSQNARGQKGNLFGVNDRGTSSGAAADASLAEGLAGATLADFATSGSGAYGATTVQTGRASSATIDQFGHNSAALIVEREDGNTASITQGSGSDNAAAISQRDQVDHSEGSIAQYGDQDSASIDQVHMGYTGATANVTQAGFKQTARVIQTNLNGAGYLGSHSATVSQYVDANNAYANITQNGIGDTASTAQVGSFDYAATTQSDLTSSATVNQYGMTDVSFVVQGGANTAGVGNTADVSQSGNRAWSSVVQNGSANMAIVRQ